MNDQLKPTNEEIAEYICDWVNTLDGYGIVVTDGFEEYVLALGKSTNFSVLREMFTPRLYNSIDEYVKDTKEESE